MYGISLSLSLSLSLSHTHTHTPHIQKVVHRVTFARSRLPIKVPKQLLEIFEAAARRAAGVDDTSAVVGCDSGFSSATPNGANNGPPKDNAAASTATPPVNGGGTANSYQPSPPTSLNGSQISTSSPTSASSVTENIMRQVRQILQKVMDANPNGVMMTRMLVLFREASGGRELPHARLGYNSPLALFDGLKDLFRIQRPTPYGDFLLLDVKRVDAKDDEDDGSEDTALILGDAAGDHVATEASTGAAIPASIDDKDSLIIQLPVNGGVAAGGLASGSTRSTSTTTAAATPHSHSGGDAASFRRPSSSSASSSSGALAQQQAAMQAKIFMLKDVLVQVLRKLMPDGAPPDALPEIFKTMTGRNLVPVEFGYRSVSAMIDCFTDICQVRGIEEWGEVELFVD